MLLEWDSTCKKKKIIIIIFSSRHIKRIIFYGVRKLDRNKFICLTPSQLQQISGRAGRYGIYDKGEVTT